MRTVSKAGSTNTKRLFQAIDALNHQDNRETKRPCRPAALSQRNAAAARSQVGLYQSLVECRILLQRCRNGNEDNNSGPQKSSQLLCDRVLRNLIKARDLLNRSTDTCMDEEGIRISQDDDSSLLHLLLRDTGNDGNDDHSDSSDTANNLDRALSEHLQKSYAKDRAEWMEVLDRRHKDVRLHAGAVTSKQFRSLDASFFDQVEAAVEHEKTRFNRSQDQVDDSRLYQQILKDFVGSSQSTSNGLPMRAIASRKPNVDRKASKGRKIRYTEIPKLAHFTFPLSRPESDLETNTWFRSLFGGAVTAAATTTTTTSSKKSAVVGDHD
jgi:Apoptosis-antagonizing transcription factor, C-terminal